MYSNIVNKFSNIFQIEEAFYEISSISANQSKKVY